MKFPIWRSAAGEIFWFGSISTTTHATDMGMRRLERGHLNYVLAILLGAFMVRVHGTRRGWSSPSKDLQLSSFLSLAYISTTSTAMDIWMWRLERADLNCKLEDLVGTFMAISDGYRWGLMSYPLCRSLIDSQSRVTVWGTIPSPKPLWPWIRDCHYCGRPPY